MRRCRRVLLMALLAAAAVAVEGQQLRFPILREYPFYSESPRFSVYLEINHHLFVKGQRNGNAILGIDLATYAETILPGIENLRGRVGNRLVVRDSPQAGLSYFLDPFSREKEALSPRIARSITDFCYYQNSLLFTRRLVNKDYLEPVRLDWVSESEERLNLPPRFKGEPVDISPDKLHLLILGGGKVNLYSLLAEKVVTEIDLHGFRYTGREPLFFLTNNLLFSPSFGEWPPGVVRDDWTVWTIDGQEAASFQLAMQGKDNILFKIYITDDLRKGLGEYEEKLDVEHYRKMNALLDTSAFRDYLDGKGLLFRPTTAVCSESRVRVRENPNLEAQTFGFLEKGDALEVVDRSGIRVKVGEMEDWWYRIQRKSDGLEGWAYGAFLQLAKKQGPIGALLQQRTP